MYRVPTFGEIYLDKVYFLDNVDYFLVRSSEAVVCRVIISYEYFRNNSF